MNVKLFLNASTTFAVKEQWIDEIQKDPGYSDQIVSVHEVPDGVELKKTAGQCWTSRTA